jgi:hypothetical protein
MVNEVVSSVAEYLTSLWVPTAACPKCGAEQEDHDGLGVLCCFKCGFCTHAAVNGKLCMLCGREP